MENSKPQNKETTQIEKRQYIRLDVVFPVEFQFLDTETGGSISDIKQGFTRDIGKGGICLEVNNIEEGFEDILKEKRARLDLHIHIPLSSKETKAVANIAWYKKISSGYLNKYLIGLSFLQIDPRARQKLYLHARRISLTPKVVSLLVLSLFIALAYFYTSDYRLKRENRKLVKELVLLSSKKAELERSILDFDSERKEIEEKFFINQEEVGEYKDKILELKGLSAELKAKSELLEHFRQDKIHTKERLKQALTEKQKIYQKVAILSKDASYFKNRLSKLSEDKLSAEDNLKELSFSFQEIEEKSMSSMYKWIKNHQNTFTGLVVSYEGDKDIEDWAFTYDQSLSAQCFTLMGDRVEAQKVFDFYKDRAKKIDGAFSNAYDAYTGLVVEYTVHAGPNIWLGISILKYTAKFQDKQYLPIAKEIAKWLIELQKEDKEFGIRGGPMFTWFSTEHNLDAYAFFGMLYKVTQDKLYLQAQERILKWIKKNAFNMREGSLNRGKGDATIATDTFAWAIAALGPNLMKSLDMDPDQVIDFAEINCRVTTDYIRPDGERVMVTGFDFGKYAHLARGGIVSTEWTAQMVVAFKIISGYHKERKDLEKASYYKRKADFYFSELEKMVIISPSRVGQGEGCLPYATQDDVDTGHGWRVARGSRTGSTAGTVYTIFAKYNYNPLML